MKEKGTGSFPEVTGLLNEAILQAVYYYALPIRHKVLFKHLSWATKNPTYVTNSIPTNTEENQIIGNFLNKKAEMPAPEFSELELFHHRNKLS